MCSAASPSLDATGQQKQHPYTYRPGCLLALIASVLLTACGPSGLPDNLVEDPGVMMQRLTPTPAKDTFFAAGRLEYYAEGKARKGKVEIMARPPHSVRMHVLTFTDDLLSLLAINGEYFTYFERGAKTCFMGPMCAAPLVSRVPMVSKPAVLLRLLEGKVPLLEEPDRSALTFHKADGQYKLVLEKGDHVQTLSIAADGQTLQKATMKRAGETLFSVSFKGKIETGGKTVPKRMRLISTSPTADLSFEYREVEYGLQFKGDPFSYECPRGTETRYLVCEEEAK
jgi:hypothetical protein